MSICIYSDTLAYTIASHLLEIEAVQLRVAPPFTWASGWKSPIYCDNRLTLSYPRLRSLLLENFVQAIQMHFPQADVIAGVATAGIPQGVLIAQQLGLPFIYVRPRPKEHGAGKQIEGVTMPHARAVLVEDLVSTGNSSLQAAAAVRSAGMDAYGMLGIFTYGFSIAEQNFETAQVPLTCLSSFDHLISEASRRHYISEQDIEHIHSWRMHPAEWGK